MTTDAPWIERCRRLVKGMDIADEVGCLTHTDCWDESEFYWDSPLDEARSALQRYDEAKLKEQLP